VAFGKKVSIVVPYMLSGLAHLVFDASLRGETTVGEIYWVALILIAYIYMYVTVIICCGWARGHAMLWKSYVLTEYGLTLTSEV
jgi:hypothetical protein